MNKKQRLELTWIGKDEQVILEPRILIEDKEKSYGVKNTENMPENMPENMLIHGDNLLALKALEQDFAGKIKCIYIDPPYNTGNAFEHYDDGVEHSIWLSLIKPRIELLHRLLTQDGTLWISIDDDESHYLKVLCDEVFGRKNFINNVIWEKKYSPQNDAKWLSDNHDHILCYAKNKEIWRPNMLPRTDEMDARYRNPDNDPKGAWKLLTLHAKSGVGGEQFEYTFNNGATWSPPPGTYPRFSKDTLKRYEDENKIWFGSNHTAIPSVKNYLSEVKQGITALTIWKFEDVGHNHEAKREIAALFGVNPFDTPKPERLLKRILDLATKPNDLILDSFLGSGTTAAVAHKMNRRWIGIEVGEHCDTHCLPRLQKVVDGTDQGGISKAVDWKGGGGFKYYYLAPSLLKRDKYDNWVIDTCYNADMLAGAMAKHEGFKYSPDEMIYWKQGRSTEKDYIFTTTNFITIEHLDKIHEEMQPDESLLICCKSFHEICIHRYPNITIKKIPKMLLGRCEFGKEDYSLNIVNMPIDPDEPAFEPISKAYNMKVKPTKKSKINEPTLFGADYDKSAN